MDIDGYKLYAFYKLVSMESVAMFMIDLIMKLMPQIKLCIVYKHGDITYKMDSMMHISNDQL